MHTETPRSPMRRVHTVKEAREALRVSNATVWRMIARDTLHTIRIGRTRRITNLDEVVKTGAPTA